ncbi:hypothetical protein MTR_2g065620 [Medicago truncatula]|uniref:Uncharacterized protein n=1 Tax=Medicago truncatula TaxID=3880 RepID=G7IQU5_MEDTR|nr:hypothetical protein MTR_2g065620 [Medicago truncatula]
MDSSGDMERDARDFRQVYERRSKRNGIGSENVNLVLGMFERDFDLNILLSYESFIANANGENEVGDDGPLSTALHIIHEAQHSQPATTPRPAAAQLIVQSITAFSQPPLVCSLCGMYENHIN